MTRGARVLGTIGWVLVSGCTFGSLADYEIGTCQVTATQSEDACERLNGQLADPCQPYQCSAATHRCEQAPRDDDRDGDPATACGGNDCSDEDATRSSTVSGEPVVSVPGLSHAELGLSHTDAATGATVASVDGDGTGTIRVVLPSDAAAACALAERSLAAPRQPYGQVARDGCAAAFVATTACPSGRLGLAGRARSATAPSLVVSECGTGVSLPGMVLLDDAAHGLAAYYGAPIGTRDRPADPAQCEAMVPAPLGLAVITSPLEKAELQEPTVLAPATRSTRPPAFATVTGFAGAMLASPVDDDVGLFALDAQGKTIASTRLAAPFTGARGVALAMRAEGTLLRLAVLAEMGCTQRSVQVAVVTYDTKTLQWNVGAVHQLVAPTTALLIEASIAWADDGGGLVASWVGAGPAAFALRLHDDATAWGEPYLAVSGATHAITDGSALAVTLQDTNIYRAGLRCP